ncbi:MAG: hypothetical protein ABEI86_14430, partial [Halobacteriaceae archaeon]
MTRRPMRLVLLRRVVEILDYTIIGLYHERTVIVRLLPLIHLRGRQLELLYVFTPRTRQQAQPE